jgi:hypothetical protein
MNKTLKDEFDELRWQAIDPALRSGMARYFKPFLDSILEFVEKLVIKLDDIDARVGGLEQRVNFLEPHDS